MQTREGLWDVNDLDNIRFCSIVEIQHLTDRSYLSSARFDAGRLTSPLRGRDAMTSRSVFGTHRSRTAAIEKGAIQLCLKKARISRRLH